MVKFLEIVAASVCLNLSAPTALTVVLSCDGVCCPPVASLGFSEGAVGAGTGIVAADGGGFTVAVGGGTCPAFRASIFLIDSSAASIF